MGIWDTLAQADALGRAVAVLLLAMSVASWVVIVWKTWLLRRVRSDLSRAIPAFWAAPDLSLARTQLQAFDREAVLIPLVDAAALLQLSRTERHQAGLACLGDGRDRHRIAVSREFHPRMKTNSCNVCGSRLGSPLYESADNASITTMNTVIEGRTRVFFCDECGHLQGDPEVDAVTLRALNGY
jgi:hypothetical protein